MPNLNSGINFDTINTLASVFKKATPVMMSTNFNAMPISVFANCLLRYNPLDFVGQLNGDKGTITLSREHNAGVKTPLRFLQWGQNCCTGLELDDGARVVFSGPFSGCSFLIAKDPNSGRTVMLHSNDNTNQGAMNRVNTIATQHARAVQYLQVFHNNAPPRYECSYEAMGMVPSWVFAVDVHGDGNTWKVFCVNLVGGARTSPYFEMAQVRLV